MKCEENYYDIVVLFFLKELEKLLYQGLKTGFEGYEDNLSCIRGKILFKEHLLITLIGEIKSFVHFQN